jgi:hypothetical protein
MYEVDWAKTEQVLGVVLGVLQAGFYISAAAVAWLTFLIARRGLLSPVNTEYHKRVMERLADISSELSEEWNPQSAACWVYHGDQIRAAVDDLVLQFTEFEAGELEPESIGIEPWQLEVRLTEQFNRWRSDPFIPTEIRDLLLDFTLARASASSEVYFSELGKYRKAMVRERSIKNSSASDWTHVNIRIVDRLRAAGFAPEQVAATVDRVKLQMQRYLLQFQPAGLPPKIPRVYSTWGAGRSLMVPGFKFLQRVGDPDTEV